MRCSTFVYFLFSNITVPQIVSTLRNKTHSTYDKIIAVGKSLPKRSIMMKLIPLRTREWHETREGREPDVT